MKHILSVIVFIFSSFISYSLAQMIEVPAHTKTLMAFAGGFISVLILQMVVKNYEMQKKRKLKPTVIVGNLLTSDIFTPYDGGCCWDGNRD